MSGRPENETDELFVQIITNIRDKKQMEQLIRNVGTINMALALCDIPDYRKIREHVFKNVYLKSIKSDLQEFFRNDKLRCERDFRERDCIKARQAVIDAFSFIKYIEYEAESLDTEVEASLKIERENYKIVLNRAYYYELYFISKWGIADGNYIIKRQRPNKLINRLAFQLSFYVDCDNLNEIYEDLVKASEFVKVSNDYLTEQMKRFGII